MNSENFFVLRDLGTPQSVTEVLQQKGIAFEYEILNLEITESNRFISKMLQIPLASKVLHFRKLRIVEGIPKSIEKIYVLYDKVKGVENADLKKQSFYQVIKDRFGYVVKQSEEEILLVDACAEEQRLLKCEDQELLMIKGTTFLEGTEPFEYFEILSVSDFYKFRSVTNNDRT